MTLNMLLYCFAMIVRGKLFKWNLTAILNDIYFRYFKYNQRKHFDNIQMINEATYEVDIGNIFRYSLALFKNISEHRQRCKNTWAYKYLYCCNLW